MLAENNYNNDVLIENFSSELARVYARLSSLFRLHRAIRIDSDTHLSKQITDFVHKIVNYDEVLICIYDVNNKIPIDKYNCPVEHCTKNCALRNFTHGRKEGYVIDDLNNDEYYRQIHELLPQWSSVLIMPFYTGESISGVLVLGRKQKQPFVVEDLKTVQLIAEYVNVLLENRAYYQQKIENERIVHEIRMAGEIQKHLSPRGELCAGQYTIHGISHPCHEVGGDYFDYFPLNANQVCIAIGDIMGKGLDASILAANLRRTLHDHFHYTDKPSQVMKEIGDSLDEDLQRSERFLTVLTGTVNMETHRYHFANAGHYTPLHYHAQERIVDCMESEDTAIGVIVQNQFKEFEVTIKPGDVLFHFTDGLIDMENEKSESYGIERLKNFVLKNTRLSVGEFIDEALREFNNFQGAQKPFDDTTFIVMKREA